jgi:hypothetical protein
LPPSLQNSSEVQDGVSQLEKGSVFDRLANPESFTGTQKVVRKRIKAQARSQKMSRLQEDRKKASPQISTLQSKDDVTPKAADGPQSGTAPGNSDTMAPGSDQRDHQSVFDRLVSPSQYTGTQKEKFRETKVQRTRAADEVAERLLDDLLESSESEVPPGDASGRDGSASRSAYTEYASQNVFERLQKTTTHSYAVRQNEKVFSEMNSNDETRSKEAPTSPKADVKRAAVPTREAVVTDIHTDYMDQDVFERLQKTSTEAYAQKAANRTS